MSAVIRDIDLDRGLVHVAFNYVVRGGQGVRTDTTTHQDRWLAIDPDTCALIASHLDETRTEPAALGAGLRDDAYLFSNDPAHTRPWNPDWATHKVAEAAEAAGVKLDIKSGRHHTASQLLAGGFELRNTAARLGHSRGGATTLRHYADPGLRESQLLKRSITAQIHQCARAANTSNQKLSSRARCNWSCLLGNSRRIRGYADGSNEGSSALLNPSPKNWVISAVSPAQCRCPALPSATQLDAGAAASSVRGRLSALSSFYRYCAAHDLIGRVPTQGVARPVVDPDYTATVGLDRDQAAP